MEIYGCFIRRLVPERVEGTEEMTYLIPWPHCI